MSLTRTFLSAPVLLLLAGAVGLPLRAEEPAATADPAQRLRSLTTDRVETLSSEHFTIRYDRVRLTREQAEEARDYAEAGWARCEGLFGSVVRGKIRLDLTPDFVGATGFARRGDPNAREGEREPLIGVRYADLEYLGLSGKYVLAHEIAHVFSGELAGTSLGEGIADWAAGGFGDITLRPWWGRALKDAGLWIDPDAFFITGEFEGQGEIDARLRTAQYDESALLVHFLVGRFGWERTRRFAEDYGEARGALVSNEDRRRLRFPPGHRLPRRKGEPRQPPDADAVRAVFQRHFDAGWPKLREEWERSMWEDRAPEGDARRLVLGQRAYGAVRSYEMWLLSRKREPRGELHEQVRAAFISVHRALATGDLSGADSAFARALALVERVRGGVRFASLARCRMEVRYFTQQLRSGALS